MSSVLSKTSFIAFCISFRRDRPVAGTLRLILPEVSRIKRTFERMTLVAAAELPELK